MTLSFENSFEKIMFIVNYETLVIWGNQYRSPFITFLMFIVVKSFDD